MEVVCSLALLIEFTIRRTRMTVSKIAKKMGMANMTGEEGREEGEVAEALSGTTEVVAVAEVVVEVEEELGGDDVVEVAEVSM